MDVVILVSDRNMNSVLLVGENQVSDAARHFKHPAANSEAAACQYLQLVIEDLIERLGYSNILAASPLASRGCSPRGNFKKV